MFYLGTHEPSWLWNSQLAGVPLFVSHMRLRKRKTPFPVALTRWALDSGGFSEIKAHGAWTISPDEYVASTRRYRDQLGSLDWAAPQDWMCEPVMLQRTGLTVEDHQHRTVESYLRLRELAPDLPYAPILQGWSVHDYIRCIQIYDRAGVDLEAAPVVGVGSVCRRQDTEEIGQIFQLLSFEGLTNLHGFGVKIRGLERYGAHLASSDSLAWSFDARRDKKNSRCNGSSCANHIHRALEWREKIMEAV
jgi:hypothetical protein